MTGEPTPCSDAEEQFLAQYHRLRQTAHTLIRNEADGCSVEATGLVHQAYEKVFLAKSATPDFQDTHHLLRTLSTAMRRILVDRARRRRTVRHGGELRQAKLDLGRIAAPDMDPATLLDLNEAMEQLCGADPESARLVEMHWFAGLTIQQVANEFGCSKSRADKIWLFARRWLARAMQTQGGTGSPP